GLAQTLGTDLNELSLGSRQRVVGVDLERAVGADGLPVDTALAQGPPDGLVDLGAGRAREGASVEGDVASSAAEVADGTDAHLNGEERAQTEGPHGGSSFVGTRRRAAPRAYIFPSRNPAAAAAGG